MVKAKYAAGAGRGGRTQAAVRYYFHRPESEARRLLRQEAKEADPDPTGEPEFRVLPTARRGFDRTRDDIDPSEAKAQAAQNQARFHYRMTLSPDPWAGTRMSEGELRDWARAVLQPLRLRDPKVEWTAVVHQDLKHPHVHALVYSETRLSRDDLGQLRAAGDAAVRQWQREWEALHTEPISGRLLEQADLQHRGGKPQGGGQGLDGGEESEGSGRNRKLRPQRGLEQGR
ncbi:hypothetical protein [uncultured Meiothermus sp.]|uniref:hypothetical protein n=1 Tax=uncultured Meiothermus sp. TaxID=157471 RepID=UPI00263388D0|nr:hypothetical protein [uncultured Meiothermus sp.]